MEKILSRPLISTSEVKYLALILLIAPLLNFLSGISIDLYAPSMPAIAVTFHTSAVVVKNTITATMLGFAVGCLIVGVLIDVIGRRLIILGALLIFSVASLLAVFSTSIEMLIIIRFIQGLATSAASIGSRTLVSDHFSGKRFFVAMLYTSLAYASGPMIAPFIGGYLQYYFGWQASFYLYAIIAIFLFLLVFLFVKESINKDNSPKIKEAILSYKQVLKSSAFMMGVLVLSFVLVEQMFFPVVGSFLIQHNLGYSSIVYGNIALLIGLSYLVGTLLNRFAMNYFRIMQLIGIGYSILCSGLLLQFGLSITVGLAIWSLALPIMIMCVGLGFIYSNTLGLCLRLFPNNIGVASATQAATLMIFGSLGMFIVSCLSIKSLYHIFLVYFSVIMLQLFLFYFGFKAKIFEAEK